MLARMSPTPFALPIPTAVLAAAALGGALAGALGAHRNAARFRDERVLWWMGGALGALAMTLAGAMLAPRLGLQPREGALATFGTWITLSALSSMLCPLLDARSGAGALASLALKAAQSPLLTLGGALPALLLALVGRRVTFRCGTLFVETGAGGAAVTLGAIVWTQRGLFASDGHVDPAFARHEAYHARTVSALGESGFYLAYLLLAAPWALARRAPWNAIDHAGRGNPFERTAYALHDEPAAGSRSRRTAA